MKIWNIDEVLERGSGSFWVYFIEPMKLELKWTILYKANHWLDMHEYELWNLTDLILVMCDVKLIKLYYWIIDVLLQPCRVFLSESDVRFMYNEMIMRTEQIYFGYAPYINLWPSSYLLNCIIYICVLFTWHLFRFVCVI